MRLSERSIGFPILNGHCSPTAPLRIPMRRRFTPKTGRGASRRQYLMQSGARASCENILRRKRRVMLNLIVNAIEAMSATSEGPRALLVSTAADSREGISIAVSDTGPGLPVDAINQSSIRFIRFKTGGLGMGLSICRSIIDAYGGKLSAKPNVPRGVVFQFSLPAHANNPLGGPGADPQAPPTP
jgi:signal transduction histidine kinase